MSKNVCVNIHEFDQGEQIKEPVIYTIERKTWKALEKYVQKANTNGIYPGLKTAMEKYPEDFNNRNNPAELDDMNKREMLRSRYVSEFGRRLPSFVRVKGKLFELGVR